MKIRSLIVEDEIYDLKVINHILSENYQEKIEILGLVSTVKDAINAIDSYKPQLLFLDIELNGDKDAAFRILDEITHKPFVIFVTAKGEQDSILKALRLSCIDYLIKPTRISDFNDPIERVYEEITSSGQNDYMERINTFRHNAYLQTTNDLKISVQEGYVYKPVAIRDMVRCESNGNYTQIHFIDSSRLMVNGNLKSFEEKLTEFGFSRISKHDLINLSHIQSFSRKNASWEVLMSDRKILFVSGQRKQQFLLHYDEWYRI